MAKASEHLLAALDAAHLVALGALPADPAHCPTGSRSLLLVGPMGGARWWQALKESPEWHDGNPDPVDRWSKRVLGAIAGSYDGTALFPSDGPPYPPFQRWALETGRMWQSPVGLLVHAEAGLWVSFRGALALPFDLALPGAARPCDTCAGKPCLSACPVGALAGTGYDVARCHEHLARPAGQATCMAAGCGVRGACPVSQSHARLAEQSAYHMGQFHR